MANSTKRNEKLSGIKTSLKNSQTITSSGIPSLDHVIGGGLPLGSVFLIEEDTYGKYSNVMFKFFIAEGVMCKHRICLATLNTDPNQLIAQLPAATNAEVESTSNKPSDVEEDMKIAWRYNNLSTVDSALDSNLKFGHYFDLSKLMEEDRIANSEIYSWKYKHNDEDFMGNSAYDDLIETLKMQILENNSKMNGSKNVLRIGLHSLGSPYWQKYEKSNDSSESKSFLKFVYSLRALVRSTYTVVMLTVPTHLFQNLNTRLHLIHCVDGCIKLDSFAGTERENDPVLRDYHGLLFLPKLITMNTLSPYVPATLDLAFKLRRKKFLIEKLHLPPELQDSSEREQDDGTINCGSMKKKNLDF